MNSSLFISFMLMWLTVDTVELSYTLVFLFFGWCIFVCPFVYSSRHVSVWEDQFVFYYLVYWWPGWLSQTQWKYLYTLVYLCFIAVYFCLSIYLFFRAYGCLGRSSCLYLSCLLMTWLIVVDTVELSYTLVYLSFICRLSLFIYLFILWEDQFVSVSYSLMTWSIADTVELSYIPGLSLCSWCIFCQSIHIFFKACGWWWTLRHQSWGESTFTAHWSSTTPWTTTSRPPSSTSRWVRHPAYKKKAYTLSLSQQQVTWR